MVSGPAPKGWFSRGHLPHADFPDRIQFVTFRLADAIPASKLADARTELALVPDDHRAKALASLVEQYADRGYGECWLRDERVAKIVEDELLSKDSIDYELLAWTVMPNHVHAVMQAGSSISLPHLIKNLKGRTSRMCNKVLGRTGTFWQREYWDRYIRDDQHLERVIKYVESNPVTAGLCCEPSQWRFGSAFRAFRNPAD